MEAGPKQLEIPGAGRKRIKGARLALRRVARGGRRGRRRRCRPRRTRPRPSTRELGKRGMEAYVYHDGENRWMVRVKDTSKVVLEKVGRAANDGQTPTTGGAEA